MTSTATLRSGAVIAAPARGTVRRSGASAALRRRNRRVETYRDLVRPLALHYASYPRGYQPFRLGPEKIIRLLERQAA